MSTPLGGTLVRVAVALSLSAVRTLIPAVALMSLVVIPREERYLEIHFPSEYAAYKAAVRRWF